MMPGVRCWIILVFAGGPIAAPLEAQMVQGRLLESGSRQPIVLGRVMLLDTAFVSVAETITDEEGRFVVEAPVPGDYWIAADRIGYKPVIDGILAMGEGGFFPADLYMRPQPIALEGLTATVEQRRVERVLTNAGFYDRRNMGFGHFIGPEEIERGNVVDVSDLLRRIPSVRAAPGHAGGEVLCNGRMPRVFVDGAGIAFPELRSGGQTVSDAVIGQLVDVGEIAGIEVYTRPSTVPMQWSGTMAPAGSANLATRSRPVCTILIWTKN